MEKVITHREVNYIEYISLRYDAQRTMVKYYDSQRASLLKKIKSGTLTPIKEKKYRNDLKQCRFELNKAKEELKIRKDEFLALTTFNQEIIN